MKDLRGWGRIGPSLSTPLSLTAGQEADALRQGPGIARGLGRSYGDAATNPGGVLWLTRGLDAFRAFDAETGELDVEAGVSLREIEDMALPRGFRLPVTPGSAHVTVGGAIANDVHGKNHHRHGSFGDHVLAITLLRSDGTRHELTRATAPDLFSATIGGLGLTGLILAARLKLIACAGPWLETEMIPWTGLDACLDLCDQSEAGWEHTVAWFDCLSDRHLRGLFTRAREAEAADQTRPVPRHRARAVPLTPPVSLVNRTSLSLFNRFYFERGRKSAGLRLQPRRRVLQPLDDIDGWNRLYGPAGFYQFQAVLPPQSADTGIRALLTEIAASGQGSMLAVLKTFAHRQTPGLLSFPRAGITLALDFPNRGKRTRDLFTRLHAITRTHAGRPYPAKDMLMTAEDFASAYPRLTDFMIHRDPGVSSGLSRRLLGS